MDKANKQVIKPKVLTWTTYRGQIEPIIEQTLCKIILHKDHLELLSAYEYTLTEMGEDFEPVEETQTIKFCALLPKQGLTILRTITTHELDESKEPINIIQFLLGSSDHWIWPKEADELFKPLKKWLLS